MSVYRHRPSTRSQRRRWWPQLAPAGGPATYSFSGNVGLELQPSLTSTYIRAVSGASDLALQSSHVVDAVYAFTGSSPLELSPSATVTHIPLGGSVYSESGSVSLELSPSITSTYIRAFAGDSRLELSPTSTLVYLHTVAGASNLELSPSHTVAVIRTYAEVVSSALSLGVDSVVAFLPSTPAQTKPRGAGHAIVRAPWEFYQDLETQRRLIEKALEDEKPKRPAKRKGKKVVTLTQPSYTTDPLGDAIPDGALPLRQIPNQAERELAYRMRMEEARRRERELVEAVKVAEAEEEALLLLLIA